MQFVPGISSAQTMPAAPAPAAAGRKPGLWILDSWRDLVLYVCTVAAGADVHRGAGVLERGVHLSLRRRLWRNGPPLAGNDSSIRRPCALSAFPMAFHLCADFFGRRLRGFFRVEPDRNCARGRKPESILRRRPNSTRNWPNRIIILERPSCVRAMFPKQLHNSKKRYASALIFQKRSKTCALPRGLALSLLDANYTNCHQTVTLRLSLGSIRAVS
jgi:hypothetical protein